MSSTQRANALLEQIDDATTRLLSNQLQLVKLASNKDKPLPTVAAETASVHAAASSLVRACEDLLVLTRSLKEAWVLGQVRSRIPEVSSSEVEDRKKAACLLLEGLNR